MDPEEALAHLGGAATRADLLRLTTAGRLRTAISHGRIIPARRGRYRLANPDPALQAAVEFGGTISHLSAASRHGWPILRTPSHPHITVSPHARGGRSRTCEITWRDLDGESDIVTSPMRTALDCARDLSFREALSVVDSALRCRAIDAELFARNCAELGGRGAAPARRVARYASGLAANPFESALRAAALDVGLDAMPQVAITIGNTTVHPDIVDLERRLVIEADSWEWHGGRDAFDRDCWRYTTLVAQGWTVVRFTWWQVVHDPEYVADRLSAATDNNERRTS